MYRQISIGIKNSPSRPRLPPYMIDALFARLNASSRDITANRFGIVSFNLLQRTLPLLQITTVPRACKRRVLGIYITSVAIPTLVFR